MLPPLLRSEVNTIDSWHSTTRPQEAARITATNAIHKGEKDLAFTKSMIGLALLTCGFLVYRLTASAIHLAEYSAATEVLTKTQFNLSNIHLAADANKQVMLDNFITPDPASFGLTQADIQRYLAIFRNAGSDSSFFNVYIAPDGSLMSNYFSTIMRIDSLAIPPADMEFLKTFAAKVSSNHALPMDGARSFSVAFDGKLTIHNIMKVGPSLGLSPDELTILRSSFYSITGGAPDVLLLGDKLPGVMALQALSVAFTAIVIVGLGVGVYMLGNEYFDDTVKLHESIRTFTPSNTQPLTTDRDDHTQEPLFLKLRNNGAGHGFFHSLKHAHLLGAPALVCCILGSVKLGIYGRFTHLMQSVSAIGTNIDQYVFYLDPVTGNFLAKSGTTLLNLTPQFSGLSLVDLQFCRDTIIGDGGATIGYMAHRITKEALPEVIISSVALAGCLAALITFLVYRGTQEYKFNDITREEGWLGRTISRNQVYYPREVGERV